jgi:hypothetical protein
LASVSVEVYWSLDIPFQICGYLPKDTVSSQTLFAVKEKIKSSLARSGALGQWETKNC